LQNKKDDRDLCCKTKVLPKFKKCVAKTSKYFNLHDQNNEKEVVLKIIQVLLKYVTTEILQTKLIIKNFVFQVCHIDLRNSGFFAVNEKPVCSNHKNARLPA